MSKERKNKAQYLGEKKEAANEFKMNNNLKNENQFINKHFLVFRFCGETDKN